MYNIHKYRQQQRAQQIKRVQDENYAKWVLKHQKLRQQAMQKQKLRFQDFMEDPMSHEIIFQDDHYKHWRNNKLFRDIQDQNKFLGFKTFRHKPNKQIGRIFTQRQRKQANFNASKAKNLVEKSLIPDQQRARSLRSQGPLHPKITFRQIKTDKQYFQPRLRYSNITDKQRILQKSITFDDKFKKVYNSFEMTKSTIGKTKKKSSINKNNQQEDQNFNMIDSTQSHFNQTGTKFYENGEDQGIQFHFTKSKCFNYTYSPRQTSNISQKRKKKKTYFKLAKTMALQGCTNAKRLMQQSQYDRKKDLSNINKNISSQSYKKRPIL